MPSKAQVKRRGRALSRAGLDPPPEEEEEEEAPAPKKTSRVIRLLTVMGYVACVSSTAVMLSVYYIFIWDPYAGGGPSAERLVQRGDGVGAAERPGIR